MARSTGNRNKDKDLGNIMHEVVFHVLTWPSLMIILASCYALIISLGYSHQPDWPFYGLY